MRVRLGDTLQFVQLFVLRSWARVKGTCLPNVVHKHEEMLLIIIILDYHKDALTEVPPFPDPCGCGCPLGGARACNQPVTHTLAEREVFHARTHTALARPRDSCKLS